MVTVLDDLGTPVEVPATARRVVSLVPSLTESVAVTRPRALVGATDWCTHPAGLEVARVRGTKNPDVARIVELAPDLVLANKEENRRRDVERLRGAGIPVWVTDVQSVAAAFASLRRMFAEALHWPGPEWLDDAATAWRVRPRLPPLRVVVPIWRDPWMVVGSRTFSGSVLSELGLRHLYADDPQRYPHVEPAAIRARNPGVVLLPDEPYRFTASDGPEQFDVIRWALIEGRALTWYGPSLASAPVAVAEAVAAATG